MTYEILEAIAIFTIIVSALFATALTNAGLEASRIQSTTKEVFASNIRELILSVQTNQIDKISLHLVMLVGFILLISPLDEQLKSSDHILLALVLFVPLAQKTLKSEIGNQSHKISRMLLAVIVILLMCQLVSSQNIWISILGVLGATITIAINKNIQATSSNWEIRSAGHMPMIMACHISQLWFFITLFVQQNLFKYKAVTYVTASLASILSILILTKLIQPKTRSRMQNDEDKKIYFLCLLGSVAATYFLVRGVQ